jgi:hypothetical protein
MPCFDVEVPGLSSVLLRVFKVEFCIFDPVQHISAVGSDEPDMPKI